MLKKIKKLLNRSIEEQEISYQRLKEIMQKERVVFIDVRSNQEFEEGHLNGAINIPVYHLEKTIQNAVKDKDTTILLYCSTGYRSKEGRRLLEELGYSKVYSLQGGIDKIWIK